MDLHYFVYSIENVVKTMYVLMFLNLFWSFFIIKEVTYITFELKADRARKCFFVAALLLCKLYNLFGIFEHRFQGNETEKL